MFLALSQTDWFWIMIWIFILASEFHLWKWVWVVFGVSLIFPALLTLMDGVWRIALVIAVILLTIKGMIMGISLLRRKLKQSKGIRKVKA